MILVYLSQDIEQEQLQLRFLFQKFQYKNTPCLQEQNLQVLVNNEIAEKHLKLQQHPKFLEVKQRSYKF